MEKINYTNKNNVVSKKFKSLWVSIRLPILAFIVSIGAGAFIIAGTTLEIYPVIETTFNSATPIDILFIGLSFLSLSFGGWFYFDSRVSNIHKFKNLDSAHLSQLRIIVFFLGLLLFIFFSKVAGFFPILDMGYQSAKLAYGSLLDGSLGNFNNIVAAFKSGDIQTITDAINPISESLVAATPYIFSGLSVAIALRCGIFNIGTEGQIFIGAISSVIVGYSFTGLSPILHISLSMIAGALGGAFWAFIPAILKTKFGSNEVINTIMLNYIAFRLNEFLLNGPIRRPGQTEPFSPYIQPSAELPRFLPYPSRMHFGFFIAIGVALFLYWFLFHTTIGLNIRMVGKNPNASKYAGINIDRNYILAFCIAGAMGGLAGANEILGVNHYLSGSISPGYGFDAITLSILGNNHPIGIIFTSLLFGTLRNGGTRMQNVAKVPIEIITIVQALVIAFIAAPAFIRTFFRIKDKSEEQIVVTRGWGK
jgi:general nucleoside transport system permease protein